MPRLLLGNFDFEWSLAHPQQRPPEALRRLNAELSTTWLAAADPEDVLWMPEEVEAEFWMRLAAALPWRLPRVIGRLDAAPADVTAMPWGWTDSLLQDCRAAGLVVPAHPPIEVVRYVNSRRCSLALEQELGCGLRRAQWMTAVDPSVLAAHPQWVIKADLSNSARERLLGRGAELSPRDRAWLEARLARDGGAAWEPWVEIVEEAGLQWEIPPSGEPQFIGVTPLRTDAHGHYRGSDFSDATAGARWADAVEPARAAARRIQAAGYFGPLGIDACRYRDTDGSLRLRPLMDVNARWTMGRLSLGWRRLLQPGERGVWRHGPPQARLRDGASTVTAAPTRVIETSPPLLGGRPTRIAHRVELFAPQM